MNCYLIEVATRDVPWTPINVMKARDGRLAIDMAERIREKLHPQISRSVQRVRRVDHEKYLGIATQLASRYNCLNRLDLLESMFDGCDALISI